VYVNTNIMALDAYRNLNNTNGMLQSSLEKLSSGYRINKAADDASGLVISLNLSKQVSGLTQASQNAQDGISVVQTAEGAMDQVNTMLQRIHDLIVESANTGSSDSTALTAAQNEISQLRNEIDRIANTTSFGNNHLLDGSFGAQSGSLTTATAGLASGVTVGSTSPTFDLTLDAASGTSLSVTVTLHAGTYATAASFQTELTTDVNAAITGNAGFTGSVTVKVTDLGNGVWTTQLVRNSTSAHTGIALSDFGTQGGPLGLTTASAGVTNVTGGVFQVGANVTTQNQISVSISDVRITGGSNTTYSNLAAIDVTNSANDTTAASLVDTAISSIATLRGQLGAYQNRLQSTISNLQVTTENLQASESTIKDTDMAHEMVNFTKDQILLQAGTAMLAQANAAPQTVLRLLQ
jgi:flagellin